MPQCKVTHRRKFGAVFVHCVHCGSRYSIPENQLLNADSVYICKECDLAEEESSSLEEEKSIQLGRTLYYQGEDLSLNHEFCFT